MLQGGKEKPGEVAILLPSTRLCCYRSRMSRRPRKLGQPQFLQFQPYRAVIGSPVRRRPPVGGVFFRGAFVSGLLAAIVIGGIVWLAQQRFDLAGQVPNLWLWLSILVALFACTGGIVRVLKR